MFFPCQESEAERRTDTSFRNRHQKNHHKESSPFEKLNIDMIYAFPTSDELHLLELGVMKRLLTRWAFGQKGSMEKKWKKSQFELVSRSLETCQQYKPIELHRAIRNLTSVSKWKGTEFRVVLLYLGMVLFENVLDDKEYYHFLLLSCATRICSSQVYKYQQKTAENMFKLYVKLYGVLYGEHTKTSNVHLLTHIVEDLEHCNVDNLMKISTYKYENALRLIGLKLRHGNKPLEQVAKRVQESMNAPKSNDLFETKHFEIQTCFPEIRQSEETYNKIRISPEISLCNKTLGDSWFLTQTDEIVKFEYVKNGISGLEIVGKSLKEKREFFQDPIKSSKLKIFASNGETHDSCIYNPKCIFAKMFCLPRGESQLVFMPLVSSLDSLNRH